MVLEEICDVFVLDFGEDEAEGFGAVEERWGENWFDFLELFQEILSFYNIFRNEIANMTRFNYAHHFQDCRDLHQTIFRDILAEGWEIGILVHGRSITVVSCWWERMLGRGLSDASYESICALFYGS